MGSWSYDPMYPPLYIYCWEWNFCDPGDGYDYHFSSLHPVRSGETPSSYTRCGGLSHSHLLPSLPFRRLFPTLFPLCPFDSLYSATYPPKIKKGRIRFSIKNLFEEKAFRIYED